MFPSYFDFPRFIWLEVFLSSLVFFHLGSPSSFCFFWVFRRLYVWFFRCFAGSLFVFISACFFFCEWPVPRRVPLRVPGKLGVPQGVVPGVPFLLGALPIFQALSGHSPGHFLGIPKSALKALTGALSGIPQKALLQMAGRISTFNMITVFRLKHALSCGMRSFWLHRQPTTLQLRGSKRLQFRECRKKDATKTGVSGPGRWGGQNDAPNFTKITFGLMLWCVAFENGVPMLRNIRAPLLNATSAKTRAGALKHNKKKTPRL